MTSRISFHVFPCLIFSFAFSLSKLLPIIQTEAFDDKQNIVLKIQKRDTFLVTYLQSKQHVACDSFF